MSSQLPLNNTDFGWMRYGLGIALPVVLVMWGLYSIISRHSYAIWAARGSGIHLVPVDGKQAILMGVASLGAALCCFASSYAQYHETLGWYYQWLLAPGIVLMAGGIIWCGALYIFS